MQGGSKDDYRYAVWPHMNFDTERHDGSGHTVYTPTNKGLNGSYKYVGTAPIPGTVVTNFMLMDKDKHDIVLVNKATGQLRILSGRLISDRDLKTLQDHLAPCSFDEGAEVRSWLRMAPGSEVHTDDDGSMFGTGPISKYKGYTILNGNKSRAAVELICDFYAYWYTKRGGDEVVLQKHTSVNEHL